MNKAKMKHSLGVLAITLTFTIATGTFLILVDNATQEIDRRNAVKRCLEEYGEGDLGMCMCLDSDNINH